MIVACKGAVEGLQPAFTYDVLNPALQRVCRRLLVWPQEAVRGEELLLEAVQQRQVQALVALGL